MLAAISPLALGLAGAAAPSVAVTRAAVSMAGSVDSMIGKYSIKGTVYDPLDLASKYDVNWLREAELKCAASP